MLGRGPIKQQNRCRSSMVNLTTRVARSIICSRKLKVNVLSLAWACRCQSMNRSIGMMSATAAPPGKLLEFFYQAEQFHTEAKKQFGRRNEPRALAQRA